MPDAPALRPMRADAARNRQQIVDAARAVISELGTDVNMEVLAARAGVGIGTMYRHFPSKQALVDELVSLILGDLIVTARAAVAEDAPGGLEVFLRALGQSFADHRGYASKLMGHTKADWAKTLRGLMDQLLVQAKQHGAIGPDIELGDVMALAWALRGIVETAGSVAPRAWERHLEIQLAGMISADLHPSQPATTRQRLARIASDGPIGSS
jgi:AcrR family transcriptional regulator